MVHDALSAEDADEILSYNKDLKGQAIDLFDPTYLAKLEKIDLPNTKIKILEQLLKQAIREYKKVNKIKAISFSERLQSIIRRYNDITADLAQLDEIINETTASLFELIKQLREERESFEALGINYEEKAFYDVLVAVEEKYVFDFAKEKNIQLAKEIHKLVTEKDNYPDWLNRLDIKAELQTDIIMLLAKNGFLPLPAETIEDYEKVYNDVINQTENFRKFYNA